ncbi:MAG TPA: lysine exporter LysO family protein [Thermoplasmata archaeon]|nr:lysine exporter LysO family protein [Thermoplasmata archaeon]
MGFDPFLYVALAGGYLVGRVVRVRSPWVPRATLATVGVLVGLLGASLDAVPPVTLAAEIPLALAFVSVLLVVTLAVARLLERPQGRPTTSATGSGSKPPRPTVSVAFVAALLLGVGIGRVASVPTSALIPYVLYVLLALVGFDLVLRSAGLRRLWIPLTAAVAGAVGAAALFAVAAGVPPVASFSTAFGFGFYSLAGPLVAARLGAVLGLLAFLTNFLREQLTMLLAPLLGPRVRGTGLAAIGGATAMDTTLYFVTRFGDEDSASLALATGFVLTVAASLLLPALLALPA